MFSESNLQKCFCSQLYHHCTIQCHTIAEYRERQTDRQTNEYRRRLKPPIHGVGLNNIKLTIDRVAVITRLTCSDYTVYISLSLPLLLMMIILVG